MYPLARCTTFVTLLLGVMIAAPGQSTSNAPKPPAASVSGHVTINGQNAPGVEVALWSNDFTQPRPPSLKTMTDDEGRFRLTGVPVGRYSLSPLSPAFVSATGFGSGPPSIPVMVVDGGVIEGIELALVSGSVISGRVVDADGQPVIGEHVALTWIGPMGQERAMFYSSSPRQETDDRGVYRIYGLPAGRYLVSAGMTEEVKRGGGLSFYTQTFYPGVTDKTKAKMVEVTAGSEARKVDIMLSLPAPSGYAVTGRIVYAENGRPAPNLRVRCVALKSDGKTVDSDLAASSSATNARGEFRFDNLPPNRYSISAITIGVSEFSADPASLEVTNKDVSGLEIKLQRSAVLIGQAVIEGNNNPAVFALLPQLRFSASVSSPGVTVPYGASFTLNPDGSFRVTGLSPGKARIYLPPVTFTTSPQGFLFLRVERNGATQPEGVEVRPGETVNDVRLVLAYGTGAIRGQVQIIGGAWPPNANINIWVTRRPDSVRVFSPFDYVDPLGCFTIRNLPAGDYEISLSPSFRAQVLPLRQIVTVKDGAESQVTFTVELPKKEQQP